PAVVARHQVDHRAAHEGPHRVPDQRVARPLAQRDDLALDRAPRQPGPRRQPGQVRRPGAGGQHDGAGGDPLAPPQLDAPPAPLSQLGGRRPPPPAPPPPPPPSSSFGSGSRSPLVSSAATCSWRKRTPARSAATPSAPTSAAGST